MPGSDGRREATPIVRQVEGGCKGKGPPGEPSRVSGRVMKEWHLGACCGYQRSIPIRGRYLPSRSSVSPGRARLSRVGDDRCRTTSETADHATCRPAMPHEPQGDATRLTSQPTPPATIGTIGMMG